MNTENGTATSRVYREADIIQWGIDRNLIGPTGEATKYGQFCKTLEEATELIDGINKNDCEMVKDAIGDVFVTLVMQAQMWGLSMAECIETAWNVIKDRKGRMVGGVFVKETAQEPAPAPNWDMHECNAVDSETDSLKAVIKHLVATIEDEATYTQGRMENCRDDVLATLRGRYEKLKSASLIGGMAIIGQGGGFDD